MPTDITIPAGQRTRIIHRTFSSIPATICFDACGIADGDLPAGTLEIQGSNWVFPKDAVFTPLQATNCVEKGYWDTFYSVYVTAETDLVVTVDRSPGGAGVWLVLAALVVVALAAAVFFAASR